MNSSDIDSLLQPDAYPDPTSTVQLIQTHVSLLFITDQFVYKVKKPVALGFLNFTTLQRRFFYCHEELRLNRRLAPELYLTVVPIRKSSRGVSFHGSGAVVEYAVKMVRLPEELMMNRLLTQGTVTTDQIRDLAGIVARFHLAAAAGPEIAPHGSPEAISGNWEESFNTVRQFVGTTVSPADFHLIRRWVERFLQDHELLLRRRVSDGFIREGDGDLHSGNICLTSPPVIFDCIEFSERYRCLDTAADVAFLLMDLHYYGAGSLARDFLAEYRAITGDVGAGELLTFYACYWAFIRGEVESITAHDPNLPPGERNRAEESARRHFRLARGIILREKLPQTLFITCGLSGSGKSAVAGELAFQLGTELLSSDLLRKRLAGIPATTRGDGDGSDSIYGPSFTRRTYDTLRELAGDILEEGASVVVDATFRDPRERKLFRDLARISGVRFMILYLRCSQKLLLERLLAREGRRDLISDARTEQYLRQKNEFRPPKIVPGEVMVVDTAETLLHTVDVLLTSLGVLPCGHD